MSRKLSVIMLSVLSLAAGLTGCSAGSPTAPETVTVTVTETVTARPEPAPVPTEKPKEDIVSVEDDDVQSEAPESRPEPESRKAPESVPELSQRGNLVKAMGEEAALLDPNGEPMVTFTVHSITEGTCTEPFAEPPENGQYIFLDVSLSTAPDLLQDYGSAEFGLVGGWEVITPSGQTSNAMLESFGAFTCLPEAQQLPSWLGPGESARGTVVLDVPTPSGTLMFHDLIDSTGWEWKYSVG